MLSVQYSHLKLTALWEKKNTVVKPKDHEYQLSYSLITYREGQSSISCNGSQHWQKIRFTWGTSRFKLDLEKAEEPEIKLPTSIGSSKKHKSSRKMFTSSLSTMPKPLTLFSSVQFSCSVMSYSLQLDGLQHARLHCPSPTPRACSNSCSLSRWCHANISSSAIPFSSCLQSFPASGSFRMSQFFTSGSQSIGVSASASVLPKNIQDWFPLGWTGLTSLQSKGLSRVFSNTTVQKHQLFGT